MDIKELGELLRRERERHGLTQEDVAQQTKISIYNIRAIETGRKEALPHPVYAKGFVKNYARLLGLDENELAEVMDREHRVEEDDFGESPAMEKPVSMPAKAPGPKKSKLPVIILLVLLIAALVGLMWYSTTGRQAEAPEITLQEQPETVPEIEPAPETAAPELEEAPPMPPEPEPRASQEPALDTTEGPTLAANATLDEEEVVAGTRNATERQSEAVVPQQPEADDAEMAETEIEESATEETGAIPDEGYVATITATELCWVYGNIDGETTTDFTLRPGQTKSLEFSESLTLKLGNAGGVKVFLNGQEYEFEAESGQVKTLDLP